MNAIFCTTISVVNTPYILITQILRTKYIG